MVSITLAFMLLIDGNPAYINRSSGVPYPTVENPTDFERERNIILDHVDNITRIDETKNCETTQIATEILPDTDIFKSLFLDCTLSLQELLFQFLF
jgi:hypothetical protein